METKLVLSELRMSNGWDKFEIWNQLDIKFIQIQHQLMMMMMLTCWLVIEYYDHVQKLA